MKSSTIKIMIVRLEKDNVHEIEIDTEIFDDPYVEATTRAFEKCKNDKFAKMRIIAECWEKKDTNSPRKHQLFNSYWVLINAGMLGHAERMRRKFKMQTDKDLYNEPLRATIKSI